MAEEAQFETDYFCGKLHQLPEPVSRVALIGKEFLYWKDFKAYDLRRDVDPDMCDLMIKGPPVLRVP